MSLSLSVLAAILFLSPGIAGFLGAVIGARSRAVRSSLPPANSLGALIAIVLIAVSAHGLLSMALLAQQGWCRSHACVAIDFDPNLYGQFVQASHDQTPPIGASDVVRGLAALTLLCLATGAALMAAISLEMRRGARSVIAPTVYGWLAAYDTRSIAGSYVVVAYVVTKMRGEELAIGYRGMVGEINLNADKEIASIVLVAADRFGLRLSEPKEGMDRTILLAELLPSVYVPGREIENIVLDVVQLEAAEATT